MTVERSLHSELDPDKEERELRGLWLSRVLFNPFVGWPAETRSFEEFAAAIQEKPLSRETDAGCDVAPIKDWGHGTGQ